MGMYDTLYDDKIEYSTQIKCFYKPIFSKDKWFDYHTWHSTGSLHNFYVGDELPLTTMYYEYPQNFCIIDEDSQYQVIEVRDGKFHGFIKSINDIPDLHNSFYTYHGEKIKISDKQGVTIYVEAINRERNKSDGIKDFLEFYKIWHEDLTIEQQIGELFECFRFAQKTFGFEFAGLGGMEEAVAITEILEGYKTKYPEKFEAFIKKHNITWGE